MIRSLSLLIVGLWFVSPAFAQSDPNLRAEVEKIAATYAENFNKQNAAGIAALFAQGGKLVTASGVQTSIEEASQNTFKLGFNRQEVTVGEVSSIAPDVALGIGEYTISGQGKDRGIGGARSLDRRVHPRKWRVENSAPDRRSNTSTEAAVTLEPRRRRQSGAPRRARRPASHRGPTIGAAPSMTRCAPSVADTTDCWHTRHAWLQTTRHHRVPSLSLLTVDPTLASYHQVKPHESAYIAPHRAVGF